jgi:hypothetical protein
MMTSLRLGCGVSALLLSLLTGSALAQQSDDQEDRNKIKHQTNPHGAGQPTAGSTGVVTPPITYHNGALMNMPTFYFIWYGNWSQGNGSDTPAGQQIVRDFATGVGNSPYFQINTTYNVSGLAVFGGETTVTGYPQGSRLRDSSILTIVNNAISRGSLPFNANGIYFVLTSSDVAETSGFCTRYCGWHTAGNGTAGHLRYSFVGNANRCLNACAAQTISPNGNAGVDGMISVIAHELEETTTDPDPPSGWVDSNGAENADKCAWTFGQNQTALPSGAFYNMTLGSRHFLIQRNLKHSTAGDTCNMDLTHQ